MKLSYRGVSYDYTPPAVEYSHSPTVGKYRGLDVRFRNPKKPLVLGTNLDLTYRGVAYHAANAAETVAAPVVASVPAVVAPAPALTIQDRARELMMSHSRGIKKRQQSMLSRSADEAGLHADISSYWNRIQGKIHPTFRTNYDRSAATMS